MGNKASVSMSNNIFSMILANLYNYMVGSLISLFIAMYILVTQTCMQTEKTKVDMNHAESNNLKYVQIYMYMAKLKI